ncbi:hypothetical protein COCVIDRAFT_42474 [Bipolaris victoriae FI3]|uniref:Protein NO VEIN C-terminal domain-containing protein n=1 Tax=Bipolaris victoriae (strain FI3) TaxID=930091 RepID=W7DZT0_BIPV3|nr:hypothetical protein COCVIDRAFT_42474 [Bipolaris victoriae FI3]
MESLFVQRLKVKRATLSMLIAEVKIMAEARQPHVENMKTRLIDIGKMLAKTPMDSSVSKALSNLKGIKFLPKMSNDGTSVLVGAEEDFAISDHQRYGDAFANSNALLDFRVHEVQSLHSIFEQMGLMHRYLSSLVKEVSDVGENCIEDAVLSQQLQVRAYALYCIEELEDVLVEQDIPPVSWVNKPMIVVPYGPKDDRPITPPASHTGSDSATAVSRSRPITPDATPTYHGRAVPTPDEEYIAEATPPPEYPVLIEQIVRSAQRTSRVRHNAEDIADQTTFADRARDYNHYATFGSRERDPFVHDKRIGAAGEGYVFELLNSLNLPKFSEANWRSTIRSELSRSTHFANIANWTGRETADIVYKDESGQLTQYLREHCEGDFPNQIREDRNFQTHPIEYFLEVKTTTGDCKTRFYMSSGQYKRMENMALGIFEWNPSQVYVIMRVYDLISPDVGLKIYIDPLRFRNTKLKFEAEQWFVSTL